MTQTVFSLHGPALAQTPLVLDSPHSGRGMPSDFGSIRTEAELRDGEDCYIDELYLPASERGVPLLAAQFARTYLDLNRDEADIDLALLDGPWPLEHRPSGKARIGKALIWRVLDDGRPIYDRALSVDELSVDPNTCWNLAPRGQRGIAATLCYLKALTASDMKLRFDETRLQ